MQDFHYNRIKNQYVNNIAYTNMLIYKLKLKLFMKTSTKIKSYLTSVLIQKIQSITMIQIT